MTVSVAPVGDSLARSVTPATHSDMLHSPPRLSLTLTASMKNNAPHVTRSVRGGVATVAFFHPAHNSLPGDVLARLADAIDAVGADARARVVVLRGGGAGAFCAGASFDELAAIAGVDAETNIDANTDTVTGGGAGAGDGAAAGNGDGGGDGGGDGDDAGDGGGGGDGEGDGAGVGAAAGDGDGAGAGAGDGGGGGASAGAVAGARFFAGFARVINAMRRCPKFIIARVHGKAVGGGVGLAAAADYALASNRAAVKLSELSVGLGPFVVGPAVTRKVGISAFAQLAIDAESFYNAAWAREKGLYAQVFDSTDELDAAVAALAARLATYHPAAMRELKRALWEDAADWDAKLAARAALSGRLAASEFTARAVREFKRRRGPMARSR